MSAPTVNPGQPAPAPYRPGQGPSGRNGFRELGKLAKWLAMACGWLATLGIGIAIGNLSRKRIDRMSHGYG